MSDEYDEAASVVASALVGSDAASRSASDAAAPITSVDVASGAVSAEEFAGKFVESAVPALDGVSLRRTVCTEAVADSFPPLEIAAAEGPTLGLAGTAATFTAKMLGMVPSELEGEGTGEAKRTFGANDGVLLVWRAGETGSFGVV